MIDQNDVKMPEQKNTEELLKDKEQVRAIEDLLDMVNSVENKTELRLKEDYYGRFHWFGNTAAAQDRSYFSYQEEAVYDFIFNLNKSGILSDQVGMGKTIEAGMIVSELASRNELRSLLIIVPNEIMAQKWEYELDKKFGIRYAEKIVDGVKKTYPQVKAIKSFDEFCETVYKCVRNEQFAELAQHKFEHTYEEVAGVDGNIADVVKYLIRKDMQTAVDLVNRGFEDSETDGDPRLTFDGKKFNLVADDFQGTAEYVYDKSGEIAEYTRTRLVGGKDAVARLFKGVGRFQKKYAALIERELGTLYALVGRFISSRPEIITTVAKSMTDSEKYPILVIPIAYTVYDGEKAELKNFLNQTILKNIRNYKHKFISYNKRRELTEEYEDYRIIDFFIDVGYQTLIVDEVHDYIDVCAKVERRAYHNNNLFFEYPSEQYNRYELFDDYYFIKKGSLYKKLKSLADKANRKIFLTATPIKSDMVDFYLLTLLASNKDAEDYKKISEDIDNDYPRASDREDAVQSLYEAFKACIADGTVAEYFCNNPNAFFRMENGDSPSNKSSRYLYPYFNNEYLKANVNNPDAITEYLAGQMCYMTFEEVVSDLILAYKAEEPGKGRAAGGIRNTLERIAELTETGSNLLTRVAFRTLLNNTIRIRFEEDFTGEDGKPIKRIRELLELEDGPRKWHKTYRKYGIRHTRHQTYNLEGCAHLDDLNKSRRERYRNLPIWPRRDGKVIFLLRDDVFFDSFLDVKRVVKQEGNPTVRIEDLPNFDKLKGTDEEKEEKFKNAVAIFDYINNSMSGGDPVTHEPQNSKYESVALDDDGMTDYKLALVNKLMVGNDTALGSVSKKVLLFAENDRDAITEWFKYQRCTPLYKGEQLSSAKAEEYKRKWASYTVEDLGGSWKVSEDTEDLQRIDGNLLVIIDPKRYEKGVDLQKADTIINFDINYCPLKMEQRIGRIDRIRPSGQSQGINIISFVPLNDMSGYVINFFANELRMFTQWMGETTGIVSVPEEASAAKNGEDVSFEGKVYKLEVLYRYLYRLCREPVSDAEFKKITEEFVKFFRAGGVKTSEDSVKIKLGYIRRLRDSFDTAFRNSISPERKGYIVGGTDERVIRFNSVKGALEVTCSALTCESCPSRTVCANTSRKKHNDYGDFKKAVCRFFDESLAYYNAETDKYRDKLSNERISSANKSEADKLLVELEDKRKRLKLVKASVEKALPESTAGPFTMPYDEFEDKIFTPIKQLYWDEAVGEYIGRILDKFHDQCDSVLKSAKLFEKFIKALSIADFMNNMEGSV